MTMTCLFGECAYGRRQVEGEGPMPARIMLIGEAPGRWEVERGRPWVGAAGKLLDELLGEAELRRADIRLANTCGCVDMEREDKRPLPAELDACLPRLLLEIEMTQPRVLLLMGNTALGRYFAGYRIGQIWGSIRALPGGTYAIPTYHPSHVNRGNHQVRPLIVDAMKLARRLAGE